MFLIYQKIKKSSKTNMSRSETNIVYSNFEKGSIAEKYEKKFLVQSHSLVVVMERNQKFVGVEALSFSFI